MKIKLDPRTLDFINTLSHPERDCEVEILLETQDCIVAEKMWGDNDRKTWATEDQFHLGIIKCG